MLNGLNGRSKTSGGGDVIGDGETYNLTPLNAGAGFADDRVITAAEFDDPPGGAPGPGLGDGAGRNGRALCAFGKVGRE